MPAARDADQDDAADLEQRAWLFVALLERASVLRAIAGEASHDEALRNALRSILVPIIRSPRLP